MTPPFSTSAPPISPLCHLRHAVRRASQIIPAHPNNWAAEPPCQELQDSNLGRRSAPRLRDGDHSGFSWQGRRPRWFDRASTRHQRSAATAPLVHRAYDGRDLVARRSISGPSGSRQPRPRRTARQRLITASGLTLLGSDDKSGVAEIMAAAEHLMSPGARTASSRSVYPRRGGRTRHAISTSRASARVTPTPWTERRLGTSKSRIFRLTP